MSTKVHTDIRRYLPKLAQVALACSLALAHSAWAAFNSGSTGADGPLNPTVNFDVQVPQSGILNYTSVNIPTGVTVTFRKNTTNSPVVLLASGDVTIIGILDVRGKSSVSVGASGNGNIGDDGIPGDGGPGGYSGGTGGRPGVAAADRSGGSGLGPGQGGYGAHSLFGGTNYSTGGGGAGFAVAGATGFVNGSAPGLEGIAYGSSTLLPLVGGSGGGGGAGGSAFAGSGGGGGGGAILIAASGTVTLTGSVLANGGNSGDESGQGTGGTGGGGSGGAIRIVATTIAGNGPLSANGGTVGAATGAGGCGAVTFPCFDAGGAGAVGRIRLEAENFTRTATSTPAHTFSAPGTVFVAGLPTLRITSVAGTTAPATPTGIADITLPTTTTQPVTIAFETTGVPVGNNVKLTVVPAYGAPVTAVSNALSGSTATANSTATVTLPTGPSSLTAQTTYTITVAMGKALSMFAQGEVVERVAVVANPGKENAYKLITVTGKEFEVALARLAGVI